MTNITATERRELIRLLKLLEVHLASAIESGVVASTGEPMPGCPYAENVRLDRADLAATQRFINRLKGAPHGKQRAKV